MDLLREMLLDKVAPDAISFRAAVCACETDMQWQQALELLSKLCMTESRQPDHLQRSDQRLRAGHATAASAGTLEQVAHGRVAPDTIALSAAIRAYENANAMEGCIGSLA